MTYENINDVKKHINDLMQEKKFGYTLENEYETALDMINYINDLGIDVTLQDLDHLNNALENSKNIEHDIDEIFNSENIKESIQEAYFTDYLLPDYLSNQNSFNYDKIFESKSFNRDENHINLSYNNKLDEIASKLYSLKEEAPIEYKDVFENIYEKVRQTPPREVSSDLISLNIINEVIGYKEAIKEIKFEVIKEIAKELDIPQENIPALNSPLAKQSLELAEQEL